MQIRPAPDKNEFIQVELVVNWPPMSSILSALRKVLFGSDTSVVASTYSLDRVSW